VCWFHKLMSEIRNILNTNIYKKSFKKSNFVCYAKIDF